MKYHMGSLSREQFDSLDAVVKATVLTGYKGKTRVLPNIQHVTDNADTLPFDKVWYADPEKYAGLTWTGRNMFTTMWVDPSLEGRELYVTVLHELAHAYNLNKDGHPCDNHGPKWRRLFGLSISHWCMLTHRQSLGHYATLYRRDKDPDFRELSDLESTAQRTHHKIVREVGHLYGY